MYTVQMKHRIRSSLLALIQVHVSLFFISMDSTRNNPSTKIMAQSSASLLHEEKDQTRPFKDGDPNFLFIGNSYTSQNNLPFLVQKLLESTITSIPERNDRQIIRVKKRDPGGERFVGHWKQLQESDDNNRKNNQLRQWLIDEKTRINWKWVILQEQSQIPGFHIFANNHEFSSSINALKEINNVIQKNGAQTLLLLTWGRRKGDSKNPELFPDFLTMQQLLTEGYRQYQIATTTKERLTYIAPAGLVYQTIYNDIVQEGQDPTRKGTLFSQLYLQDGSHPSLAGSYLTALTIFTTITGKDPTEVTWSPVGLDINIVAAIQDAVRRTISNTYNSGTIEFPWSFFSWLQPQTLDAELEEL